MPAPLALRAYPICRAITSTFFGRSDFSFMEISQMFQEHIKSGPYSTTIKEHEIIFLDEDKPVLNATFVFDEDIYPLIERSNAGDAYSCYIMDTHASIACRDIDAYCLGTGWSRCLICGRSIYKGSGGYMLLRLHNSPPKHPANFAHRICVACCYPSYKQPDAMRRAIDIVKRVNA